MFLFALIWHIFSSLVFMEDVSTNTRPQGSKEMRRPHPVADIVAKVYICIYQYNVKFLSVIKS